MKDESSSAKKDAPLHVEKPWGAFRQYTLNEQSTVKILTVAASQRLSEQYHRNRDELWIALDAGVDVEIDGTVTTAVQDQEFFIPRGALHRLTGGKKGGRVLEISFGLFDENDIIRTKDIYGRK